MNAPPLRSAAYEVADAYEANELFQRNGWTDGLPIVPPTEDLVRRFLAAAALGPGDLVGVEPVRRRRITAEKAAIAAVMAGCTPECMPVVAALVRAVCEPEYGLHGCTASTGGSAPFVVVNGPIRREIGMNATHNALANGSRANAAIGRTLRLLIINVLGGTPGRLDPDQIPRRERRGAEKAAHQILGGRHDRQPVRPAVALEQLVRLVAVGDLVRRRPERRRVHRRHAVRRSPLSAPLLGPSRDLRWGSIPVPPNVTGRRSLRYHAFHRSGPRSTAPPVAPSRRRFAMSSGGSAVTAITSATSPASTLPGCYRPARQI